MWKRLLSKQRYYGNEIKEDSNEEYYRSSFHKDYDRLIFSNAFRRLSRKTQVHPLSKHDHVHNRLTHSLEVASVGRSLGLKAGEILKNKYDDCDKKVGSKYFLIHLFLLLIYSLLFSLQGNKSVMRFNCLVMCSKGTDPTWDVPTSLVNYCHSGL